MSAKGNEPRHSLLCLGAVLLLALSLLLGAGAAVGSADDPLVTRDRKSTRLNSSHIH